MRGRDYEFPYNPETLYTPDLVVRWRPGKPRERHLRVVEGMNHGHTVVSFNPTAKNMLAAVLERQKYVKGTNGGLVLPPQPNHRLVFDRLRPFSLALKRKLGKVARISREQFLSESPPDKYKIYERAIESLLVSPIGKRDAHIKAFPKYEKLLLVEGKRLVPRCISPRSPRFNVEIGTFIRPMEHRMYAAIGKIFKGRTVSKGDNADMMGRRLLWKWNKFTKPVAVGLDASRFDQHVSRVMLLWAHSVYLNACEVDRKVFAGLLRQTLRNKCTYSSADGYLKWVSEGGRMSGDMDTAMGNCLIMCALVYTYSKQRGVATELYNNGDDCTVIMEQEHYARWREGLEVWFMEMGFNMKVEPPVYKFEQIEFCQTHPIFTDQGPLCVRNFPSCIDKDLVSVLPIRDQRGLDNYFASIGKGGLALTGGVPILSAFYNRLIEWSDGATGWGNHPSLKSGMIYMSQGMKRGHSEPGPATRVSFFEAFGVTPDEQVYWEEYYRQLPKPVLDLREATFLPRIAVPYFTQPH